MKTALCVMALGCFLASPADAQDTLQAERSSVVVQRDARIAVHRRIRFRLRADTVTRSGRITEIRGDTLVVARGPDAPLRVPLADLSDLSVYRRGKDAEALASALATTGLVAGTVLYISWCSNNRVECERDQRNKERSYRDGDSSYVSVFTALSLGTAFIGGFLGYYLTPSRWEAVDRPFRIGVVPTRRGVALVATVALGRW